MSNLIAKNGTKSSNKKNKNIILQSKKPSTRFSATCQGIVPASFAVPILPGMTRRIGPRFP
ncbi:hypothetical protein ACNT2N_27065 [Pseudomonas thivervalensis]|uniref:hypothetical protein n=1 Tax=Pseudomonas thivervalensis TaxID=86265 RepID=UPI000AB64E12|nr:hypothetical protein [Pseudomonas thivervalensis]